MNIDQYAVPVEKKATVKGHLPRVFHMFCALFLKKGDHITVELGYSGIFLVDLFLRYFNFRGLNFVVERKQENFHVYGT